MSERGRPPGVLIGIAVPALEPAVRRYGELLGRPAFDRGERGGEPRALFALENAWLELRCGTQEEPGLASLALDIEPLAQSPHEELAASSAAGLGLLRRPLAPRETTRGVLLERLERMPDCALETPAIAPEALHALDHIVIRTSDCEAALELYQQRLGLRLALDRMLGPVRMLFFRTAGVTIEVVHDARLGEQDAFYGLAYRARDLPACHARLAAAGFALDAIREGRKPGTRVFSVRDGTSSVPTLVLHDEARG